MRRTGPSSPELREREGPLVNEHTPVYPDPAGREGERGLLETTESHGHVVALTLASPGPLESFQELHPEFGLRGLPEQPRELGVGGDQPSPPCTLAFSAGWEGAQAPKY